MINNLFFIPTGINIGPLHIAFYAIFIIVGAITAYKLSQHFLKKKGFDPSAIENLFYIAFPMGIVGARVWYVIAEWEAEFANAPWYHVFEIWQGGLAIQGGVIFGVIAGVLFMILRRPNIPVLLAADCIVPNILIAQAIGRWGNFFNQEVYGKPIPAWNWLPNFIKDRLTYQINQAGTDWIYNSDGTRLVLNGLATDGSEMVMPLFLIEGIINVAGFFIIMFGVTALFKFIKEKTNGKISLANGDLAFAYLIWYGTVRAILEPLRNDAYIMGDLTSVYMSIAFIVAGIIGIGLCHLYKNIWSKKQPILNTNVISGSEAEKDSISIHDLANVQKTDLAKKMAKVEAILIDIDGTLVDTDELVKQSYLHLFSIYRKDYVPSNEELNSFLGPTLKDTFPKYFKEDFDTLEKDYHDFAYKNVSLAKLYPHVEETLVELKKRGYRLGIVTSRLNESMMQLLSSLNIDLLFDVLVSLDDVENPKPNPEGIKICLEKLNIKAKNCLYLGDNYSDYLAAKNAHVISGLVTYVSRDLKNAHPNLYINDFSDLLEIFKGVNSND